MRSHALGLVFGLALSALVAGQTASAGDWLTGRYYGGETVCQNCGGTSVGPMAAGPAAVGGACNTCNGGCNNGGDCCRGGLFGYGSFFGHGPVCMGHGGQGCHGCRGGLFGHGCHHGKHGDGCNGNGNGLGAGYNCTCNGSYKFPVPPLYTYHWPGMYSQQLMTDYHSPWRFPPLKPYVDEVDNTPKPLNGAASYYSAEPVRYQTPAITIRSGNQVEPMSEKMKRIYR